MRVKQGGEKIKRTKLSNSSHQKYELLLKGKNKKMVGMVRRQGELLKIFEEIEKFFNQVGLSRSNSYSKIRLHKLLTKLPVLSKGGSDLYVRNGRSTIFCRIFVQENNYNLR